MLDGTLVITDTSCLIVLSRIGALDLLHRLYRTVIVTDVIAAEYGEPLPEWMEVRRVANIAYQRLLEASLDAGEASAIALAIETGDVLLVVDDLKARREAARLNIPMTGTLGIIFKAKENGVISEIAPLIAAMEQAGFRVAPAIVDELLRKSRELN